MEPNMAHRNYYIKQCVICKNQEYKWIVKHIDNIQSSTGKACYIVNMPKKCTVFAITGLAFNDLKDSLSAPSILGSFKTALMASQHEDWYRKLSFRIV